jgi:hypothetical protein
MADATRGPQAPPGAADTLSVVSAYRAEPLVRDSTEVAQAAARVITAGQEPSAAGDLALLFAYMKVLDPGSVVRESEFRNASNTAGIPERVLAWRNRVLNGERLSEATRADFLKQTRSLARAQKDKLEAVNQRYRDLATRFGIDPALVVSDPFASGVNVMPIVDPFAAVQPIGGR